MEVYRSTCAVGRPADVLPAKQCTSKISKEQQGQMSHTREYLAPIISQLKSTASSFREDFLPLLTTPRLTRFANV